MRVRNTFVIFLLSGFWHGATWTFIVWGALNALYFLPLLLSNTNRTNLGVVAEERTWPTLKEIAQMAITFGATVIAWVFFRAESLGDAWQYLVGMFTGLLLPDTYLPAMGRLWRMTGTLLPVMVLLFFAVEWVGRRQRFALQGWIDRVPAVVRWGIYYALAIAVIIHAGHEQQFIYFQF